MKPSLSIQPREITFKLAKTLECKVRLPACAAQFPQHEYVKSWYAKVPSAPGRNVPAP